MADIYAHPTVIRNPGLVELLEWQLGLQAIAEGRRVRLVAPQSGPTGPHGIEQRGRALFAIRPAANLRCEDRTERPL